MIREIITRSEAKARGLNRYYTGKPGPCGHLCDKRTINSSCVECNKEKRRRYRATPRGKIYAAGVRHRRIAKDRGITLEEYQNKPSACEACGRTDKKIVLDHCHVSNRFRGWLCDPCNRILGLIGDNPKVARGLADYLEAFEKSLSVGRHGGLDESDIFGFG